MTDADVLALLKCGAYRVDVHTGEVFTRGGAPACIDHSGKRQLRASVILQAPGGKRRKIAVGKLVWMAATGTTIPDGWHVHHVNENRFDNRFANLMCVHTLDHAKLHAASEAPIPL